MSKDDVISKIYNDPAGYGSIKTTLADAKKKDKTITVEDVRKWYSKNVEQKTKHVGQNSFVAKKPYQEFQVDIFFIKDLQKQKFTEGLLMIDIFTKYLAVMPLEGKSVGSITAALLEGFRKMGGVPEMIYADNETSMGTPEMETFFKEKNIKHVATRGSAPVAERTIRTFKNMLYKRIGDDKTKQWTEFIYPILLTYNSKNVHSSTGFTPTDAKKAGNHMEVKANMELKAKHGRKYEEIKVGDKVKVFKKKKAGMKQQVSYWSEEKHEIVSIEESLGQKYYKVEGQRPLLRHEILKTN